MLQIQRGGLLLALLVFGVCLGCCPNPQATEFPARYDNSSPLATSLVPVIFEGLVLVNDSPAGQFHSSRIDGHGPARRWRCKVRVENVLQGNVPQREVDIFYFIGADNLGSSLSPLVLLAGARRIFFLQWDGGELRTIYDGWENSVEKVYSGAHPGFKRAPQSSVTEAIVDLLLTRGEGASDKSMIEAVYRVGGRMSMFGAEVVIKRLQQIAREETLPVKQEACYFLAEAKHPCEGIAGKEQFRSEK
jgi:hypothetical protein